MDKIMKKIELFLFTFISIFAFMPIVMGAGVNNGISVNYSISASKTTVNAGGSVDITIKVSGATKKIGSNDITLTYDATKFKYENFTTPSEVSIGDRQANANTAGKVIYSYYDNSGGSNSISGSTIVTFTFKALERTSDASGSFEFRVSGVADENANVYTVATSSGNTSVTIHVPSTNNNLQSLSLSSGTLSPAFDKNTTNYTATVDAASVTINASAESSSARISGVGNVSLNYGTNTKTVLVTSESGDVKSYVIKIMRPDNRSSVDVLSSLNVSNTNIKFDGSQVYSYTVENNITEVNVTATAKDNKASVTGIGTHKLSVGSNNIQVTVTAENGSKRIYVITIIRKSNNTNDTKVLSNNNYLSSLTIEGTTFEFNKNTTEYTLAVPYSQSKLVLKYNKEVSSSIATVIGNDELQIGNNSVSIVVTAEDGSVRTYSLTIMRNEEKNIVKNDMTSLKSALSTDDNTILTVVVNENETAVSIDKETLNLLREKNKTITYEWTDASGVIKRSLTILGKDIPNTLDEINPNISLTIKNDTLLSFAKGNYIAVGLEGSDIPTGAIYNVKVDKEEGTYYLYYVSDGQIISKRLIAEDYYVELKLSSNTDYIISGEEIVNEIKYENNEKINLAIPIMVVIIVLLVISIVSVLLTRYMKNKRLKEITKSSSESDDLPKNTL